MNTSDMFAEFDIDFNEDYGIIIQHPVTTRRNFAVSNT